MRRPVQDVNVTRSAFTAASAISIAMFLLVLGHVDVRRALSGAGEAQPKPVREAVTFVEPHEPITPAEPPTNSRVTIAPSTAVRPTERTPQPSEHTDARTPLRDTSSAPTSRLTPSPRLALPSPPPTPFVNPPQPRPYIKPEMTAAERDSNLAANLAAPLSITTQMETRRQARDSLSREYLSPGTIPGRTAGEQGIGGAGAMGGFGLPVFSSGPSKDQRKRDSIAHASNLEILARLQERARRKRDSMRVADSSSRHRGSP